MGTSPQFRRNQSNRINMGLALFSASNGKDSNKTRVHGYKAPLTDKMT